MSTTTNREIQEALSTHSRGNPWHTEEPRIVTMLYKIRNNLVDIAPVRLSFCNILVNTLGSTSFNGF
jgi:hypothetical protein